MNKDKLKRKFITRQLTAYKLFESEVSILKKLHHPNIVQAYEIINDPGYSKAHIVMEYISEGSLYSLIKKGKVLPLDMCWKYFRDLLEGIEYCHEVAGVIHRDIKPDNLLLTKDDHVKLVDFGISYVMNNGLDEERLTLGSSYYLAPEMCKGELYKGKQTDVWAAGVTLYQMTTGKLPFEDSSIPGLYRVIINTE
jgi:[calcium/calmodulin-dependent protein kinase] kinase